MKNNKKIIIITSIILGVLILTISLTYAIFSMSKTGQNSNLVVGDVYMHYANGNKSINLANAMPSETYDATSFFEFTIDGKNTTTNKDIWYEIILKHGDDVTRKTRIKDNLLKFTLTETKDGKTTTVINGKSYGDLTNKRIWVNTISKNTTSEVSITYRLYMWISNNTVIGNTDDVDYTTEEWKNIFASIKVDVAGDFNEKTTPAIDVILPSLEDKLLSSDGDSRYVDFSKNVDNNYVWYSGKLWKIVAINDDNTIKLITDKPITNISAGSYTNFANTWQYQYLNEDFLDTLYNYQNIIVTDYSWNETESDDGVKPEKTKLITAPVGLLNNYELHNMSNYISDFQMSVSNLKENSYGEYADALYPAIVLKDTVVLKSGIGTINSPYQLVGDKLVANKNEKLNTRSSGEYVKFDDKLYRIVEMQDGKTKLIGTDVIRDVNNEPISKGLALNYEYGTSTTDDYWDYYLNNTWYNNITKSYKDMIVDGIYYLGDNGINYEYHFSFFLYGLPTNSYKTTLCQTISGNVTTKTCTKSTNTWSGKIATGRIGEFFLSSLKKYYNNTGSSATLLTITPYSYKNGDKTLITINRINYNGWTGVLGSIIESGFLIPTLFVSSNVKIVSGTGLENDPYEISLT